MSVSISRAGLPKGPRWGLFHVWPFIQKPRSYSAWLRRRYGEIVTLQTPTVPLVLTLTPDGARQVLTADPDSYDAIQKKAFTGLTGPGSLWVLAGSRHRSERQLVSPPFHARRIRSYAQTIRDVAVLHTDKWRPGQQIRAYDVMLDISRDVILRVVFGMEEGPLFEEGRQVLTALLHVVHPFTAFVPAFQSWWFPPWVRFQRAKKVFAQFVANCLMERRSTANESQDVLGLMLAARCDDGTPMSDDAIRDQLVTILLAGHETTAVAMAWALYELGRNPATLEQLREELDALGPEPEIDLIVSQPYLGAVCDETLRLHTILTEVARVTARPQKLFGYDIPVGTSVAVSISAIHQDPSVYPKPDEFRPERFIERRFSPFEFLPFGGGNRRCLGAALSDYEMRIALATIVTRWEFEIDGEEREIRHNIGTGPKYGVRMRVTGRRRAAFPPSPKATSWQIIELNKGAIAS